MTGTVESFIDEYARRYIERNVEGVTDLCHWPFLAVRRGEAILLRNRDDVRDHFASAIGAYRFAAGVENWTRVELETRQLGEHSVFATAHWNALDADGNVVRDTWTSYQLLATPDGWRMLSYTNHFRLVRAGAPRPRKQDDVFVGFDPADGGGSTTMSASGTTAQRGYGSAHQRRAQQVIAAQPWCSTCGHTGSPDNPLTADHVVPVARGGVDGPLRVLCRRCNSRRGNAAIK